MTIDWWTLGLQTVNIAVLVWLLQRFFWRPVAGIIEQRQAAARAVLADAEVLRVGAVAAQADIAKTRAGFDGERAALLAEAQADAGKAGAVLLDEAGKAVAARDIAALAAIEAERAAVAAAWSVRSSRLAVAIARRLAARLDGPAVRDRFLDWLIEAIGRLPAPSRLALAEPGATLGAVSATPISPADEARARSRIGAAFGGHPAISFSVDPALIAGFELHAPHLIVANSWRADLDHILSDLDA